MRPTTSNERKSPSALTASLSHADGKQETGRRDEHPGGKPKSCESSALLRGGGNVGHNAEVRRSISAGDIHIRRAGHPHVVDREPGNRARIRGRNDTSGEMSGDNNVPGR